MGTIDGCQGTAERCSRTEPGRYCPPQSSVLPRSAGSFPCSRTERLCDRQHTRHMSPCRLPCFGSGRCRECRKGKKKRGLPRKLLQVAVGIDSQGGVLLRLGSRGLAGTGDSMDAFLGHVAPGSIVYHDMGHFSGCFPGCTARTFRYGCRRMRSGRSRERGLSFSTYRTLFYREIFLSGKPSEDGMFTNISNNFVYPFLKNKKIRRKRKNPC